ncbi:MAG: ATP F0F1 synthase subunit B [Paracoccaceae bacterium]
MSLLYDSNVLTLLAFLVFVGILAYYGVFRLLARKLDERAERISAELERARQLREEAQKRFAEFERQRGEVEGETREIVDKARRDAEAAAEKAKEDLKHSVDRRLKAAEEQIATAETKAVREVQSRAVAVAVEAAATVMRERMNDDIAGRMIDRSIETVGARLN